MGTPHYATTIFEALLKSDFEVKALFTQPDKPVGRKQILTPPHIKQYCLDNDLAFPIFQPKSLRNNSEMALEIKNLKPDFIVVAAYGQILPKEILDIAPCINLHASLLPLYRGASPIQEALLNNDNFTGVTSMLMEEGLDTGDILGLHYLKVTPTMEVSEAFETLSHIAAKLTLTTLKTFENIVPKKQNNVLASLCKKIKKEDGEIAFTNAQELYLKYKAYSFWPGIFTQGGLKLKEIELLETTSRNKEGVILDIGKDYLSIGCLKGAIKVKILQMPSKKELNAGDFLRGNQTLKVGSFLIKELFPEFNI